MKFKYTPSIPRHRTTVRVLAARTHIFRVNGPGENENFSAVSVPCSNVSATGDERRDENVNTRFFFFFLMRFFRIIFLVFCVPAP